jgi:hypothetical protein
MKATVGGMNGCTSIPATGKYMVASFTVVRYFDALGKPESPAEKIWCPRRAREIQTEGN